MNHRERSRGQGLVEFALIFPIFMLILFGIFDVGRLVFAYTSITNAAREGARLAIVNQGFDASGVGLAVRRAQAQSSVAESNEADATKITVTYVRADANGQPTSTACDPPVAIGCLARVTYATKLWPITPIVRQVIFNNGITMTATSVLPVEFTCPNDKITLSSDCPKQP